MITVIRNNFAVINVQLPNVYHTDGSCCICFEANRLRNVMISLNYRQLVEIVKESFKDSNDLDNRAYLQRNLTESRGYILKLAGCYLEITDQEAASVISIFDDLKEVYLERIDLIEEQWKSNRFHDYFNQFMHRNWVPLLDVKRQEWEAMQKLAREQKYIIGEDKHLSDGNGDSLSVYGNTSATETSQHLVSIFPKFESSEENVTLVWQPPERFVVELDESLKLSGYWNAETTYIWLVESMIPLAQYENKLERHKKSLFSRVFHMIETYEDFKANYSINYSENYQYKYRWGLAEALQSEQYSADIAREIFKDIAEYLMYCLPFGFHFTDEENCNIYRLLHLLLQEKPNHKLMIELKADSWDEVVQDAYLLSKGDIKTGRYFNDIEIAVCVIHGALNDNALIEGGVEAVVALLKPLATKAYQLELLSRQWKRCGYLDYLLAMKEVKTKYEVYCGSTLSKP